MIQTTNIDFTLFYDCARQLVEMYKQELENQKVNASGELSRTADFDVDFDDDSITLYFQLQSYWYYVEHGRRPTGSGGGQSWTNSISDIEKWINDKISRGWFVPRNNRKIPHTPQEIKRVAYSIVKKIHSKGFYGQTHYGLHVLEEVMRKAEASGLLDKMVQSVAEQFEHDIDVEFQKI